MPPKSLKSRMHLYETPVPVGVTNVAVILGDYVLCEGAITEVRVRRGKAACRDGSCIGSVPQEILTIDLVVAPPKEICA